MLSSRTPNPLRLSARGAKRGVALVATLAILVIVTVLLVAYVTMMRLDQSATTSYSQGLKAEQLGLGALQVVVGELQKEMGKDAAANLTYPDAPVFTNVTSTNILPQLVGTNATMTNLVKISTTTPLFTGTLTNSTLKASTACSTNLSRNQRFLSAARWSRTGLGSFPTNAPLPNWMILTRDGPTDSGTFGASGNTLNNPAAANINFALGRFAFAIYDVGGLLNVNVAGFPADAANFAAGKGSVAWADLSQIPGIHKPDAFVKWRNAQSATSGSNYLTYVDTKAAPDGFASISPGDTTFLSRSDLLRYAESNPDVLDSSALPYLTTFSRDANAPNWGPPLNGTGAAFQYKADADAGTSINRFLPNVRVTVPFTRSDGTAANIGDSLVSRRFPLARLELVRYGGTAAAGSDIHKFFGLTRAGTSAPWVYDADGDGTPDAAIKTLKEVADAGREPNFFELLQTVVLSGSLGVNFNNTIAATKVPDANYYHQVMRVGANILDQYDADNFPTAINFAGYDFYGIEDIPYPNEILTKFITSSPAQIPAATPNWFTGANVEICFEMWNPHQQVAGSANARPTAFRIVANPEANYSIGTTGLAVNATTVNAPFPATTVLFDAQSGDFREPLVVRVNPLTPPGDPSILSFSTSDPQKAVGFKLTGPAIPGPGGGSVATGGNKLATMQNSAWFYTYSTSNMVFSFQYQDVSHNWQTYATSAGIEGVPATGIQPAGKWVYVNSAPWGSTDPNKFPRYSRVDNFEGTSYLKSDPRTWRFGLAWGSSPSYTSGSTSADNPLISASGSVFYGSQNLPWGAANFRLDWMSQNGTAAAVPATFSYTHYKDRDAITRAGDSYLSTSNQPMKAGQTFTRPIILNRPFRSVGELGYVFRDLPWKTLDLFSANSADSGLADVFSVEDSDLTSGRVNLNTRSRDVLKSLLAGVLLTGKSAAEGEATMSSGSADGIAQTIISSSIASPLVGIGDLAACLAADPSQSSVNKMEREAAMRALAGSTSTRTWNLLIDLVAQSGKFPPNATSLDDFVVEGTRRYWMHVAIDRYTGKVIDKYLETVND